MEIQYCWYGTVHLFDDTQFNTIHYTIYIHSKIVVNYAMIGTLSYLCYKNYYIKLYLTNTKEGTNFTITKMVSLAQ